MEYLGVAIIALLMSALFSAMKHAFLASNKFRFELNKNHHSLASRVISVFAARPQFFITAIRTCIFLSLMAFTVSMANIIIFWAGTYIQGQTPIFIFIIIITAGLAFLVTEIVPKTFVWINPDFVLNVLALPVFLFYLVLYPVAYISHWLSGKNRTGKDLELHKAGMINYSTDIAAMNNGASNSSDELKLIQNAIGFSSVRVRECMIPRPEIVALEINTPVEILKKKFFETGFSKILIYENHFDNLVGYVTLKELFKNPKKIAPLLIEVSFVPEAMPARILLHRLIQDHKSIAVVIDEFGGISGLVTVEDIIEEIFGEIEDEHDSAELTEKVIGPEEYIFSGRLEIDYLNNTYNLNIPESEEYDTLAGYIFYHFQSFPKINEKISIAPFEFKILKVSKTRIELVRLKVLHP
jgi:CBS domain containing-hemolysin-like protein